MIDTVALLEGIAHWLDAQGLAQYNAEQNYNDDPALPAVVFAAVDAPDHTVTVEVVEDYRHASRGGTARIVKSGLEVRFTFRATGKDSRPVETLAHTVLDAITALYESGPRDRYNVPAPGILNWGAAIPATNVKLIDRKPPELTSKSKYSGARYTVEHIYHVGVY